LIEQGLMSQRTHYRSYWGRVSNFKDHYGDVVITQCLGKIAKINEFSAFDEMLWVTRQTGRQQVDCSKVEGRQ